MRSYEMSGAASSDVREATPNKVAFVNLPSVAAIPTATRATAATSKSDAKSSWPILDKLAQRASEESRKTISITLLPVNHRDFAFSLVFRLKVHFTT
ncbi:hypothetical protein EV132_12232 [Rhizobium sullae]|uniref:Uncharacterized protein n=1 Tax=Rhizobium sullae TaxID=50338 RepID=A0A4R3PU19_RHISU|nr:hypothetical protein EV132_12232 [Rhizobium sullae]